MHRYTDGHIQLLVQTMNSFLDSTLHECRCSSSILYISRNFLLLVTSGLSDGKTLVLLGMRPCIVDTKHAEWSLEVIAGFF